MERRPQQPEASPPPGNSLGRWLLAHSSRLARRQERKMFERICPTGSVHRPGTTSVIITEAAREGMTPEGERLIRAYYSTEEDTGEFIYIMDSGD